MADTRTDELFFLDDYIENDYTDTLVKLKVVLDRQEGPISFVESLNVANDLRLKPWLRVANNLKDRSSKQLINEGTFIKLGRQVLYVSKISSNRKLKASTQPSDGWTLPDMRIDEFDEYDAPNQDPSAPKSCRICLEQEASNDPFENDLCQCSRKVPIHFRCLDLWLQERCNILSNGDVTLYDIDGMSCEVCGDIYPLEPFIKGKKQAFFTENRSSSTYLTLHVYSVDDYKIRIVAQINLKDKNKAFRLGRDETNDIVFKDPSVSQLQAHFVWQSGQLSIYDDNSKFGTFIGLDSITDMSDLVDESLVIDKFHFVFTPLSKSRPAPVDDDVLRDPVTRVGRLLLPRQQVLNMKISDNPNSKIKEIKSLDTSYKTENTTWKHRKTQTHNNRPKNNQEKNIKDDHKHTALELPNNVNAFRGKNSEDSPKQLETASELPIFGKKTLEGHERGTFDDFDVMPDMNAIINSNTNVYFNNKINFGTTDQHIKQVDDLDVTDLLKKQPSRADKKLIKSFKEMRHSPSKEILVVGHNEKKRDNINKKEPIN